MTFGRIERAENDGVSHCCSACGPSARGCSRCIGHRPSGRHFSLRCCREIFRKTENGVLTRRSEEHTSELQSLMRISYAVFCLKKKKKQCTTIQHITVNHNLHTIM